MAEAIFAAGCFWGVEQAFRKTTGVLETAVGYIGGNSKDPTYQEVCTGQTGHAEAVKVQYDPIEISFEALLNVFWSCHNPTQVDRQGPDVGTQYRSAIFYVDDDQRAAAEKSKLALQSTGKLEAAIATQIVSAGHFYMAEDYHQQYFEKRGQRPHFFGS